MPKRLAKEVVERILVTVRNSPDGLSIKELSRLLGDPVSRRSLQRRLSELVAAGKLTSGKGGRSTRYFVSPSAGEERREDGSIQKARVVGDVMPEWADDVQTKNSIPLSPSGAEVRRAVRKLETERTPIGYKREFLDEYRPNESRYLTPETLAHLARIGRTPESERPAGTYARHILDRLLVDLSWASSRLEGNTYSLLDTKELIEHGQAAEGKDAAETQMILNHKAAIEFVVESAGELAFNKQMILNIHALLSDNLLPDPGASGRLRQKPIGITHSVYRPLEMPQLIEECFQQIVDTAAAIRDPFEQAFFAMVQLPYLQPFDDVNKRVSRLAANIPLVRQNLCPLSFVDVPERDYVDGLLGVYELNRVGLLRDVFVWAYERSCQRYVAIRQSLGEPDRFRLRFRNELSDVVNEIVRRLARPSVEEVAAAAEGRVPPQNLDDFVRMTIRELENLHEGNYARFRLRPSEYQSWRESLQRA